MLIKGGFICSIPVKPPHSIAGICGSVHTYPDIFFKIGDLFVHFSLPSTRDRHFRAPKTQVFTNGRKSGVFRKRRADRRIQRILNTTLRMLCKGMISYFSHVSVFMWTGEKDSNTLRVDAYFGHVWTGPYCF